MIPPAQMYMNSMQERPTLLTGKNPVDHNTEKELVASQKLLESEASNSSEEEAKDPTKDYVYRGVDFKPALPAILEASTVIGAMCVFVPTLAAATNHSKFHLAAGFFVLYVTTLACMAICSFVGPGQIKPGADDLPAGRMHFGGPQGRLAQ